MSVCAFVHARERTRFRGSIHSLRTFEMCMEQVGEIWSCFGNAIYTSYPPPFPFLLVWFTAFKSLINAAFLTMCSLLGGSRAWTH